MIRMPAVAPSDAKCKGSIDSIAVCVSFVRGVPVVVAKCGSCMAGKNLTRFDKVGAVEARVKE